MNQQEYRKVASSKKEDALPVGSNESGAKKSMTKTQPILENSSQLEGEIIHNYEPQRRNNDDSSVMSPEEEDEGDYGQAIHHFKHEDMPIMDERENDLDLNNVANSYRSGDLQHMENYQYPHHAADQYQNDMAWDQMP